MSGALETPRLYEDLIDIAIRLASALRAGSLIGLEGSSTVIPPASERMRWSAWHQRS
jgi:hypothetical protein